ncbi:MAG: hypothetical protein WDA22_13630 [Bacteroidota bacterium]
MNWLLQIETELQRIQPNENPGRTRTTARRIAGIALQQFYNKPTEDFLRLLQSALRDASLPNNVGLAIERLTTRLNAHFHSLSVDPINDAMIVVDFVKMQLKNEK